jgi:NADH:ubiquinone oxidoreductase subunit 5 (subunit L)/multisubunit Na+/H+ antiporter MnhA subunit
MPATAVAAAIAAASIAGVPAFSGFMSKWAVISSGLLAGREAAPFVFFGVIALMTSAITLASYVKFFGMTFTSSGIEWSGRSGLREVGATMLVPQGALALLCVLQGMLPFVFFGGISAVFAFSEGSIVQGAFVSAGGAIAGSGLGIAVRTPGGLPAAAATPVMLAIAVAVAAGIALWLRRSGGGARSEAEVWLCGYQRLNDANRYRSSNMYAAFKDFMKWTGGNDRGA